MRTHFRPKRPIPFFVILSFLGCSLVACEGHDAPNPRPTVRQLIGGLYIDGYDGSVSWSPDSRQIAFARSIEPPWTPSPGGIPQIWIISRDGTGLRQITNELWGATEPSWSPDGQHLAYVSKDTTSCWNIFLIRLSDGERRQVARGISPTWGRADSILLVEARCVPPRGNLGIVSLPTGAMNILPRDSDPRGFPVQPRLSPDGRSILFTRWTVLQSPGILRDVCIRSMDGSLITQLTSNHESGHPCWAPDGRHVLYVSEGLWLTSIGDSALAVLPDQVPGPVSATAWSPDRSTIVFVVGSREFWLIENANSLLEVRDS